MRSTVGTALESPEPGADVLTCLGTGGGEGTEDFKFYYFVIHFVSHIINASLKNLTKVFQNPQNGQTHLYPHILSLGNGYDLSRPGIRVSSAQALQPHRHTPDLNGQFGFFLYNLRKISFRWNVGGQIFIYFHDSCRG